MGIKILLVDDHKMFRDGLRRLLADQKFEVVGEAENGRDAVRLAGELALHIVVMDAQMPDLNGVEATRQIIAADPTVKVIGLSAHSDTRMAGDMLAAGAMGYVLKESTFEELTTAIANVIDNKLYLSPGFAKLLAGDYVRQRSHNGDGDGNGSASHAVSRRECEVLRLIAEGKSTKEAAVVLALSVKTIETHRRNIMQKLKIDSVAELTKYAVREGITSL